MQLFLKAEDPSWYSHQIKTWGWSLDVQPMQLQSLAIFKSQKAPKYKTQANKRPKSNEPVRVPNSTKLIHDPVIYDLPWKDKW